MSEKTIVRINASSLVLSRCLLAWHRTIVQGYKQPASGANLIYGVAVHKFIDTMFKTEGRLDLARTEALKSFRVPKYDNQKSKHLSDENHLMPVCFNLWDDYVLKDDEYEVVKLSSKCWWCADNPLNEGMIIPCPHCNGTGIKLQAATEVTFSIKYYEDDDFIVFLEGTIDAIGKFKRGCYAIRDWKTTSTYDSEEYLSNYEMSAPLRFYVLSLKLMAEKYPDSMLGKIGATTVGAFIDGVFIKPKTYDTKYGRSEVFQFSDADMTEFRQQLDRQIHRLLAAMREQTWTAREGIINGTCENKNKFSKCDFFYVCKAGANAEFVLAKNFIQKPYDPLHHQD